MPPRRWYADEDEEQEEEEVWVPPFTEDTVVLNGVRIPSLSDIRDHVMLHAWNGSHFERKDSHEDVFSGQCEYASTAISEILTGTGLGYGGGDWSLRVRGWYKGDLSSIKESSGCDSHAFDETDPKHCHSWVVFGGKIIDPTWWQFADDQVKVYYFELDDPRFVVDADAEEF